METVSAETIKITSNNPQLLPGLLIIAGICIFVYTIIWIKLNSIRYDNLKKLNRQLDEIHNEIINKKNGGGF